MEKQPLWKDYSLHLCVLVCSVVAEFIGPISIPVGNMNIKFMPLIYSMLFMLILYLIKPIKFLKKKQAVSAGGMLSLSVALLCAKLGVTSGAVIEQVLSAGPVLLIQQIGGLGTIVFGLPLAIFLGMKREAIGLTHANSREPNVALISEKYGADSDEFKGVITMYIVGTIFGSVLMSVVPTIVVNLGIVSPEAASMGLGVGSAAMMSSGLASLIAIRPDLEATMTAFASLSNIMHTVFAVYMAMFLALPISEKVYSILEPLSKKKRINEQSKLTD